MTSLDIQNQICFNLPQLDGIKPFTNWLLDMNEEEFEDIRQQILSNYSRESGAMKALLIAIRIKIEKRINKLNKI
jgi:hypothetical protein